MNFFSNLFSKGDTDTTAATTALDKEATLAKSFEVNMPEALKKKFGSYQQLTKMVWFVGYDDNEQYKVFVSCLDSKVTVAVKQLSDTNSQSLSDMKVISFKNGKFDGILIIGETGKVQQSVEQDMLPDKVDEYTKDHVNMIARIFDSYMEMHVPDVIFEKMSNIQLPFVGMIDSDKVTLSLEFEDDHIIFVLLMDAIDSAAAMTKPERIWVTFKNKKWISTVLFDEHGKDFVDMASSPLFGDMSDEHIEEHTSECVNTVKSLLDSPIT